MPGTEPATVDDLAGHLHAITGGVAALQASADAEALAASSAQLALVAARADLDAVLPGLPPAGPPATGDAQALAAQLRELGHAFATWAQSASGDEAVAATQAALHVDEAARRLAAILR